MMVLFLPATLGTAWMLAIFWMSAPGSFAGEAFADNAISWMMALPAGGMFVSSSIMHIVFAKQTAANIGWQSNGFQYEVGCCSFGLGAAGIWAAYLDQSAWFVLAIVISCFLLGASFVHIREIIRKNNRNWGNTAVLLYDLGLPVSLWALYVIRK